MSTSSLLKDLQSAHVTDVAWRDEMIRELREALKFYADEKNYQRRGDGLARARTSSLVDLDNGKIAREALEKK